MKKILWLSRHKMSDVQLKDLERIYGAIEVKQVDKTVSNVNEIVVAGADCNILAVVLPPNLLSDLINPKNNTKPVIRAVADRVETGDKVLNPTNGKLESQYKFVHKYWEKVIKIEVITEKL